MSVILRPTTVKVRNNGEGFQGFNAIADNTAQRIIASIPKDYTTLSNMVDTLNSGGLNLKDDVIAENVSDWLNDHPEATTTVLDGSLTESKFSDSLKGKTIKDYVTPEMFGAVGDGIVDDTNAIQDAINNGRTVRFKADSIYKITGITVGADTYLYGNGAKLVGNGSGTLLTIQTYTDAQTHDTLPSVIEKFILENADILIDVNKANKITLSDIVLVDFNVGIRDSAGYELVCNNFRFEGDATNLNAIALQTINGGDAIFNNFIGRDVATVMDIRTAGNIFNNFHFWCIDQTVYDSSIFINENAISNGINRYNSFYFDSYKTLFIQNGQSYSLLLNPSVVANERIVTGESTLYVLGQSSELTKATAGNRFKVTNIQFHVTDNTVCNIVNDPEISIQMTYYPPSNAIQALKISSVNILDLDRPIRLIAATSVFSFTSDVTVKSGQIIIDRMHKRVTGNLVIQLSTALPANSIVTIGTPIIKPKFAINGACFVSNSEWGTTSVAYLYISSSAFQVKANESGMNFVKFDFDYLYD